MIPALTANFPPPKCNNCQFQVPEDRFFVETYLMSNGSPDATQKRHFESKARRVQTRSNDVEKVWLLIPTLLVLAETCHTYQRHIQTRLYVENTALKWSQDNQIMISTYNMLRQHQGRIHYCKIYEHVF